MKAPDAGSGTAGRKEGAPLAASSPPPDSGLSLSDLINWATYPEEGEPLDFVSDEGVLPRIGGYELLAQIGRGGMGIIYKARHIDSKRIVAVKVMQSHGVHTPEVLRRFRREAQAAARLEHPNVLPIYEVSEEADGTPFFAMKFAAGGSLRERRRNYREAIREIVTLMAKVSRGTAHAHERGVLHRDLKPDNILFDTDEEPLVSDFGLAGWLHQQDQSTKSVTVCGTPGYLPPEFLEGRPEILLPASDVYSLGVILFELITGRLPFLGTSAMAALTEAATQPAPRLSSLSPSIDLGIEMICSRCLETEPELRYSSAAELADDLERWLAGRKIVAQPRSRFFHIKRGVRKWKRTSLAAALCLALVPISWLIYRHQRQATEEAARVESYNRTIGILPIEDLDALEKDSEPARIATTLLTALVVSQPERRSLTLDSRPDPMPPNAALSALGQTTGARFLIAGTIRRQAADYRIVLHVIDSANARTLKVRPFELRSLDAPTLKPLVASLLMDLEPTEPGGQITVATHEELRELAHMRIGDEHYSRGKSGDLDSAIAEYQAAADLSPHDARPLAAIAAAMAARSEFGNREAWLAKALSVATNAVQANPGAPEAQASISRIHMLRGEYEAAREHGMRAYELDPANVDRANALAEITKLLGNLYESARWREKAGRRHAASR